MIEKITLFTGPVKVSRKRKVDHDHAIQVLDLARRGYRVTAKPDVGPWWVSIDRADGPLFVNQPEGTEDVLFIRPMKGMDDGRLFDEERPEWVSALIKSIRNICPPNIYVRTGYVEEGDPSHG